MKVKIEKVIIGAYEYDSVVAKIDNKETEIVFSKKDNVAQYKGKEIELINDEGVFKIKPLQFVKK